MVENVPYKQVGRVVILYPKGNLQGLGTGPLKVTIRQLLETDTMHFVISFKNAISTDRAYATALNSIYKEVQRSNGNLILSDAGFDVLPWLEKYAQDIPVLNTEEMAIQKLAGKTVQSNVGNIAVVGISEITKELFKGISNYKGLIFHYFDDPVKSIEKVIELKPRGIVLNLESGTIVYQSIRKLRFSESTHVCPIILYGPPSLKSMAPNLIKEGANDFIEVKFDAAEVLAYLKPLEFRNVLAKKLDLILSGEYGLLVR